MKPAPYETGDIVSYRDVNYAVRSYNAERDRLTLWNQGKDAADALYHGQEINADNVTLVQRTVGMSGSAMDELFSDELAEEAALVGQPTRWTQEMLYRRLSASGRSTPKPASFEALHQEILERHDAIGRLDALVIGDRVFRTASETLAAVEAAQDELRPTGPRRNGTGGETVDGRVEDWLKTRRRGDAEAAHHRYERDADEGKLTWATALADATTRVLVEDEPTRLREELVALAGMTLAWIDALEIP